MPSEYPIVHIGKVTCGKCGREVVICCAAPPDYPVTDEVRWDIEERGRQAHEGECLGR